MKRLIDLIMLTLLSFFFFDFMTSPFQQFVDGHIIAGNRTLFDECLKLNDANVFSLSKNNIKSVFLVVDTKKSCTNVRIRAF